MKSSKNITGFTLIEVLVAMTIFGVIMISVVMIFTVSTQISLKSDVNREMQQNLKSVVETIAEDVRKSGVVAVSNGGVFETKLDGGALYLEGEAIETGLGNKYYLADYESVKGGDFNALIDPTNCVKLDFTCVMIKKGVGPLSNGSISFTQLKFYVSNGPMPKITLVATVRPSARRGISPNFIKNSELQFQTTFSERALQIK